MNKKFEDSKFNDLEAAMKNIDIDIDSSEQISNNESLKNSPNNSRSSSWIEKMKLGRKSSTLSNIIQSETIQAAAPKVKCYRRSSFSALIHTPLLKRSDKKKHAMLRKTLSASTASINSPAFSLGRVYLRVHYDPVTHVLSVNIIQSNKLQHSERQKSFPRVQFHLSLSMHGDVKSTVYKTRSQSNSDLIDIKESFYFPNIDKVTLNELSIVLQVSGKDRMIFGTEKILSNGTLLLDNLKSGEQLYCSVLMEECLVEFDSNAMKKDQIFPNATNNIPISVNIPQNSNKLQIGLKYDVLLGNLTLDVMKGTNFFDQFTADKSPSTYIKMSLINVENTPKTTEVEYETKLVKSSPNPSFNQSFEFNIPSYELESYSLNINVFSKRLLTRPNLIGCIIFDCQSKHNQFVEHLYEAVSSDGEEIIKYHSLI